MRTVKETGNTLHIQAYAIANIRKPWDEAKSLCMSSAPLSAKGDQKTTLASIPDRETNIFVSKLAPGTAWIGGYKYRSNKK